MPVLHINQHSEIIGASNQNKKRAGGEGAGQGNGGVRERESKYYVTYHTVLPFARGEVDVAVKVGGQNGLGIKITDCGLVALLDARTGEVFPALAFAGARRTHEEDAVPDAHQLVELHNLEQAVIVRLQAVFDADLRDDLFIVPVALPGNVDACRIFSKVSALVHLL
jgi:hypothetical protein